MELWRPDPTFYPSPKMAMQAPPETVAFVAMLNAQNNGRPDALGVVDAELVAPAPVAETARALSAPDSTTASGSTTCRPGSRPHSVHSQLRRARGIRLGARAGDPGDGR